MKYFTMQELDEIAKELMENPSRETLKKLNDKYNAADSTFYSNQGGTNDWVEVQNQQPLVQQGSVETSRPQMNYAIDNKAKVDLPELQPLPETNNTVQSIEAEKNPNSINIPVQNVEMPMSFANNNNAPVLDIQPAKEMNADNSGNPNSINLGQDVTPMSSTVTQNIEPSTLSSRLESIPFNGNLWESQNNGANNMMQTTDNFNTPIEVSPDVSPNKDFFGGVPNQPNNPIPVMEPPKYEGPTMFGQFEQNYNNNAA